MIKNRDSIKKSTVNKQLIDQVLTKSVTFKIEIKNIDKNVPENQIDDFKEWLQYKSLQFGLGLHYDYYSYTDNYKDDIGVSFYVYSC